MDERTKKNIATLVPKAQPWAEAHMDAIVKSGKLPAGWSVRIISGNRTWAEQDALYAIGRHGDPRPKVTNARGGQSNHNFGIAWDIGVFDAAGKYVPEHALYGDLGPVGVKLGLEWGGNWVTIKDRPHYQVKVGLSTSQLRDLMIHHKPIPVPEFGGAHAEAPTDKISVFDGEAATKIPAFLEGGRVWVGVRAFVDQFGGEVVSASDSAFTIELHGDPISFPGKIKDGVGYAKFADVNLVLGWGFKFSGSRLVIDTK